MEPAPLDHPDWNASRSANDLKEALPGVDRIRAIASAGPGGGVALPDNHGEVLWQVPGRVLLAISAAVRKWGVYPLDRVLL